MFAALTVTRLREEAAAAGLSSVASWVSPDDVEGIDLPLAKAAEKVLASMHSVLTKTKKAMDEVLTGTSKEETESEIHLRKTKAAEVKLVRNLDDLRNPVVQFKAESLDIEIND
jgi:pyridoxine kinase